MNLQKLINEFEYHLVDATATTTVSTPVYTALETIVVGMSPEVSIKTRLGFIAANYIGGGRIVAYFRDVYKKMFNVTETTKEATQKSYDRAYIGICNFCSELLFSTISSYTSTKQLTANQIILGAALAGAVGLGIGALEGYSIDSFRDLFGLKPTKRLPAKIREQPLHVKKIIATEFICLSLALTTMIYVISPYISPHIQNIRTKTWETIYNSISAVTSSPKKS